MGGLNWPRANVAAALVLLLAGCSSYDDVRAQLTEVEMAVGRLERQVEALGRELQGQQTAPASPVPPAGPSSELLDLQASVLRLEAQLKELPRRLRRAAEPPARSETIPGSPRGERKLPRAGETVEVLTVGAGDLLLVRAGGSLERLRLLGVEAPQRERDGQVDPERRQRHEQAFREELDAEAAWQASRDHLEGLLEGKTVRLRYARAGPRQSGGALEAYVEALAEGGVARDVGAAMVREGYALAWGAHDQRESYEAMERAAREEGAGLLRPALREAPSSD